MTMRKLIGTSRVAKNGQTVLPGEIMKFFNLDNTFNRLGWFIRDDRIEIAAMQKQEADYSIRDLGKLVKLAGAKGGKVFKSPQAAKDHLARL